MKKIYLLAAAAALFAACSSEKDSLETQQQPTQLEESAVGFDVYTQKATTRAGWAGSLTTAELKKNGANEAQGFGVFGYYTDNNDYEQRSQPNFFYNQQVKWNGSTAWEYEPVKYWPNEYGSNAESDDADKVTYFAYAPYVEVIPTSGKIAKITGESEAAYKARETWGITSMTRNTNAGDPILKYIASFNSKKSVDLCWGVADNNDGHWPIIKDGSAMIIDNGNPWINVLRPANTNQRVKFTFKHALSQLRVNIDAVVDINGNTPIDDPEHNPNAKTRVWVRQVTFKGFTMKGALNLNNDDNSFKPNWLDYNGQNELVAEDVTVYDGRKDGKEGVNGAIATNEKVLGLNPTLIQDGVYQNVTDGKNVYEDTGMKVVGITETGATPETSEEAAYTRKGVTATTVNLFAQSEDNKNGLGNGDIFHVIPTDDNFEIEIVYDVETVSENLAQNLSDGQTKGTSIENRIRKAITFGDATKLQPGNSYTLNLHLGLNSVKFDAAVTDWVVEAAQDVDLPLNVPIFGAELKSTGSSPAYPTGKATISYDATKYTLAINGLDGGESVDATAPSLTGWAVTNAKQNAKSNGIAIEELTTAINPLTSNRTQAIEWSGKQSSKGVNITFTQLAHPLQLYVTNADEGATDHNKVDVAADNTSVKTFTLSRSGEITGDGWICQGLEGGSVAITPSTASGNDYGVPEAEKDKHYIRVWRNGVRLTWAADLLTDPKNKFTFTDAAGTLEFGDALHEGDVYTITLKTGDAPEETITVKII